MSIRSFFDGLKSLRWREGEAALAEPAESDEGGPKGPTSKRANKRSKKKAETKRPNSSLTEDMNGKPALAPLLFQTSHPLLPGDDSEASVRSLSRPVEERSLAKAIEEQSVEERSLAKAAADRSMEARSVDAPSVEDPLLLRAQRGDSAAFRSLFLRHSPGVRRYLGDLLRDDAAADDATQETFLRAFDSLRSLRDGARLSSWLFGIARNVFLEQCRARADLKRRLEQPNVEVEAVDQAPTPDAALLLAEADRVLADALSHVGEPRKSALLLRLDHGLSYEDIADVMGWSVAKVKNEIHRGRLQLRAQLLRYLGGSL